MTMHRWTILFGLLLVATGLVGYYFADAKQPIVLIPAVLGIAMFVCGVVAAQDAMRILAMHVAALIGLIGFVCPVITLFKDVANTPAVLSRGLTSSLCLMFVMLCVNSFLEARRARKAGKKTDEALDTGDQDLLS